MHFRIILISKTGLLHWMHLLFSRNSLCRRGLYFPFLLVLITIIYFFKLHHHIRSNTNEFFKLICLHILFFRAITIISLFTIFLCYFSEILFALLYLSTNSSTCFLFLFFILFFFTLEFYENLWVNPLWLFKIKVFCCYTLLYWFFLYSFAWDSLILFCFDMYFFKFNLLLLLGALLLNFLLFTFLNTIDNIRQKLC